MDGEREEIRDRRAPPGPTQVGPSINPPTRARSGDPTSVNAVLADIEAREQPIRLRDVPGSGLIPLRNGKKVHLSVVHRWATSGLRGYRLETARCPGLVT